MEVWGSRADLNDVISRRSGRLSEIQALFAPVLEEAQHSGRGHSPADGDAVLGRRLVARGSACWLPEWVWAKEQAQESA